MKAAQSKTSARNGEEQDARPVLTEKAVEIQQYGEIIPMPLGLSARACKEGVDALNGVLADTITIRDLYKKHHWQISGATFYQLHLLFDKHYAEQAALVDQIAERIQILGGISVAMAADVADLSRIRRPPRGREDVLVQLSRLLAAHEVILFEARDAAKGADEADDVGTNDLLVSNVIRTNELQVWFLAEHLVPMRLAEKGPAA